MEAATYDTPIKIESKTSEPEPVFRRPLDTWTSITGDRYIMAEVRDPLPSRSEAVRDGMVVAAHQTRVRFPYMPEMAIDSTMRVRVFREREELYQIVGGPAEIGRKDAIELACEKYSTGRTA